MIAAALSAAIGREEIADYVAALFIVYLILIVLRILLSWVTMAGRLPDIGPLRSVASWIQEVTDPYLNLFRRVLPPLGGRGFAFDLSPIIGIFVLMIASAIVVGLIRP